VTSGDRGVDSIDHFTERLDALLKHALVEILVLQHLDPNHESSSITPLEAQQRTLSMLHYALLPNGALFG